MVLWKWVLWSLCTNKCYLMDPIVIVFEEHILALSEIMQAYCVCQIVVDWRLNPLFFIFFIVLLRCLDFFSSWFSLFLLYYDIEYHTSSMSICQVWDLKTTDCLQTFKPPPPLRVSFHLLSFLFSSSGLIHIVFLIKISISCRCKVFEHSLLIDVWCIL